MKGWDNGLVEESKEDIGDQESNEDSHEVKKGFNVKSNLLHISHSSPGSEEDTNVHK